MPRFVILEHTPGANGPAQRHWDLMLESAGVLRTWALAAPLPTADGSITATALPDHRLAYLDYEGPISGERGSVRRIARGTYEPLQVSPDLLRIKLADEQPPGGCNGVITLQAESVAAQRWRLDWSAG